MVEAKVKKAFLGAADGEIYPRPFAVGDIVKGNLADVAIVQGWADPVRDPTLPLTAPKEKRSARS